MLDYQGLGVMAILRSLLFFMPILNVGVCLNNEAEQQVVLAIALFRHGDRTPVDTYPNDPYKEESNWYYFRGVYYVTVYSCFPVLDSCLTRENRTTLEISRLNNLRSIN